MSYSIRKFLDIKTYAAKTPSKTIFDEEIRGKWFSTKEIERIEKSLYDRGLEVSDFRSKLPHIFVVASRLFIKIKFIVNSESEITIGLMKEMAKSSTKVGVLVQNASFVKELEKKVQHANLKYYDLNIGEGKKSSEFNNKTRF
jgi:hypothetical protein